MSTRRLIMTALVCGMVILLAGGAQLLRLSRSQDRVVVLREGQEAVVGDARAKVVSSRIVDDRMTVAVEIRVPSAGSANQSAADPWSLLAGGVLTAPTADGSCRETQLATVATTADAVACEVVFPVVDGTKTLAFRWGDAQRQWQLAV